MATLIPLYNMPYQLVDSNGDTAVGGSLEFYLEGTTTATDLFTSDGTSIGTSITLNAWGMPESGGNVITLFRDQSKAIKVIGKTAGGVTIYTSDNLPALASFDATASAKLDGIAEGADVTNSTTVAASGALLADGTVPLTGDLEYGSGTYQKKSVVSGIVASTTQTQAGGTALTGMVNVIATVANDDDAIVLPAGVRGREIHVFNDGANRLQIFPPVDGDIDGGATNASTTQEADVNVIYSCTDGTSWLTLKGDAISAIPSFKSYTFASRDAANGENFVAGYYDYAAADANLTNASTTVNHGTANVPYAAHAFAVTGGAGTTDGTDLVLTVSGTSITDAGVRTAGDSEVVIADGTASVINKYYETSKKWLGTITYTLSSTSGATFTLDFNYGYAKYEDFGNRAFTITDFESLGLCNVSDSGFEIELIKHSSTGWTYHATAFVAGNTAIETMTTTHSTESDPVANEFFAFKRSGLSTAVAGNGSEGVLVRVTTSVNNSISHMDAHVGVTF